MISTSTLHYKFFTQSIESELNVKEPIESIYHIVLIHHKMVYTLAIIGYKTAQAYPFLKQRQQGFSH